MSVLDKFFGKKQTKNQSNFTDYSYIAEIAGLISSKDEQVCENIELSLTNSAQYFSENTMRFDLRGIDVNSANRGTLHWISLVDELSDCGFSYAVDYKCGLEDFLGALEQLKSFNLVSKKIAELEFDENGDPELWGKQINDALNGEAFVCWIDIDSDSYELIAVTAEVYEKISTVAENNRHRIVKF